MQQAEMSAPLRPECQQHRAQLKAILGMLAVVDHAGRGASSRTTRHLLGYTY